LSLLKPLCAVAQLARVAATTIRNAFEEGTSCHAHRAKEVATLHPERWERGVANSATLKNKTRVYWHMRDTKKKKTHRKDTVSFVSLFSSFGLGDLGVRAAGGRILAMAEMEEGRCEFLRRNYPDARIVQGDLWETKDEVVRLVRESLGGEDLFLLVATPPCQGNSTLGKGRKNKSAHEGKPNEHDRMNQAVLPGLDVIKQLRPLYVVIENTRGMNKTAIPYDGRMVLIPDLIKEVLGSEYVSVAEVVKFANYGVAQSRKRLITILTRDANGIAALTRDGTLLPPPTHARPITLRDAIGHFEALDGRTNTASPSNRLHRVRAIEDHYDAIARTPEGCTAFDNQCARCGFTGNPTFPGKQGLHCSTRCEECGHHLPRPMKVDLAGGEPRILFCYKNGYKRMSWDKVASTVIRNFLTASSSDNLHPDQNRTLSPAEVEVLQTVDRYAYEWGEKPTDTELGDALGEAVPPLFFEKLTRHLVAISKGTTDPVKPRDDGDREPRPATTRTNPTTPPVRKKETPRRPSRESKSRNPSISQSRGRKKTECNASIASGPTTKNAAKRGGKGH